MINVNFEKLLDDCEDLEFLNKFSPYLRETEYRVLLLVCGHTKYGKVPIHRVGKVMKEYWDTYKYISHIKNYTFILQKALMKIEQEKILHGFT